MAIGFRYIGNRRGLATLSLLLLPPLLPHPPLALVPVPAWVFRLELVSGILGLRLRGRRRAAKTASLADQFPRLLAAAFIRSRRRRPIYPSSGSGSLGGNFLGQKRLRFIIIVPIQKNTPI